MPFLAISGNVRKTSVFHMKGHVPNFDIFELKMETLRVDRGTSRLHFVQKKFRKKVGLGGGN